MLLVALSAMKTAITSAEITGATATTYLESPEVPEKRNHSDISL